MSDLLRLLVTSDWHLDASTAGHDRYDDLDAAVAETVAAAVERECSHYLFLGDLCDPDSSRAHRSVAVAVRTAIALDAAGVVSRWLVGNHDVVEDGRASHTLAAVAEVGCLTRCVVHPRPAAYMLADWLGFVALPYVPRSHAYDPEAFVRAAGPALAGARRVIVAGHLNVAGVTPGSETEDMPRGRDVFFPLDAAREVFGDRALLLNGHYHRGQVFEGIHIPGSLERLTFGEADHDPGYLVLEVSDA